MIRPLLLACLLALAGCAGRPPVTDIAWSAPDARELNQFVVHGKVGFRRSDTGGSAALTWKQSAADYELLATGPMGQGATRIRGNAGQIAISRGDETLRSDDPGALLADMLGWPVAIDSLAWWVRGLPAPGAPAEVDADAEGKPARIRQQGWDILLDRWRASGERLLPHRLVATGGDSRITLLIERWDTPPPSRRDAR